MLALFVLLLFSCKTDKKLETAQSDEVAVKESIIDDVKLEIHDYNGLEPYMNRKDDKIYVVNFWATWCAPCKREMPSLEKLTNKYPEIKVYAINTEKPNKLKIRDFFRTIGVASLETYYDPDFKLVKQFKMRGLPTSILINKDGEEFGRVIGEVDFVGESFLKIIKKYI